MSDVVDVAIVELNLHDNVSGEMARAVAEVKAQAAELGHTRAKIKIDADTLQAKTKLDELRAEMAALDKDEKKAATGLKQRLDLAEKEYKQRQLNAQVASVTSRQIQKNLAAETVAEKTRQRAADDTTKSIKEQAKAADRYAKDRAAAYKMDEQRTRDLAKSQDAAARMDAKRSQDEITRVRNLAKEQNAAAKEDERLSKIKNEQGLRDAQQLERAANLQERFSKAQERFNSLSRAHMGAQGSDKVRVEVQGGRALAEMARIRAELDLMGMKPIDIPVDVKTSGMKKRLTGLIGGDFSGINPDDNRMIRDFGNELQSLGSKLNKSKVNIFGLSIGVKTLLVGMAALSPVITGLIGAAGSLVSVFGAGLAGGIGVGATALTGFGMAALGVFSNVKPFVTSLSQAHKYTLALDAAQAKYGATSKKGKQAQQQFNKEMQSLPPLTRQTVEGFQSLKERWQSATGAIAQHDIGKIVGSSFKMARANMGFFAKDTNTSFNAIAKGWSGLMSDFSSSKGQASLSNIFGKSAASITPLLGGFRALASVGTSMMSNFANFLPGLSKGFQTWAQNLSNSADKSHGFAHGVQEMVAAMRSVGHFAQAAGKFLIDFFKAGVGPGIGFLDKMTSGLNKLSASMNTVGGQKKLTNFFERGVETTSQLWNALTPLVSAFVQFGQATAPIANIMLQVASAFIKVVGALVGFKPLQWAVGLLAGVGLIAKLSKGMRELVELGVKFGTGLAKFAMTSSAMGPINAWKAAFGGPSNATAAASFREAIVSGATAGSAEMGAEIRAACAAGAAELAGGVETGSAAGAAEQAAASTAAREAQMVIPGLEAAAPVAAAAPAAAGVTAGETAGIVGGETTVAGLGAAAAAAAGPIAVVAGGLAALTLAIATLGGTTQQAGRAERDLADVRKQAAGVRGITRTVSTLPTIRGTGAAAVVAGPSDQRSVNSLQAQYNKLVAEGAQNSAKGRAALQALNGAIVQQQQDQTAANDSIRKAHGLHVEQANDLGTKVARGLNDVKDAQDAYNKANKQYQTDTKNSPKDITKLRTDEEDRAKSLKALTAATKTYNNETAQAAIVQDKLITDNINSKRVTAGMPVVLNNQSEAVGRLGKQIALLGGRNANKAFNFVVHTPNPADLVKISNIINNLAPKNKTAGIKIIADSKTAEEALRRLAALQIKDKEVKVAANLGNTVAQIAKIQGIKLTPKMQHLLSTGGPGVVATVARILGIKLPPKTLRLLGEAQDALNKHHTVEALRDIQKALTIIGNNGQALAAINAVGSAIAAIPGVKDITFALHTTGSPPPSAGARSVNRSATGNAPGAVASRVSSALANVQNRAAVQAIHRSVGDTKGGMYNKPTYLVGEENRAEYVISTNPSYRRRNLHFLAQAASSLGAGVIAAAGGAFKGKGPPSYTKDKKVPGVYYDPRGYTGPRKHRHKVSEKTFMGVPAQDRIGGVGTSDIDTAVSNTAGLVSTDQGALKTIWSRVHVLQRQISRWNSLKKPTDSQKSAKKAAEKELRGLYTDEKGKKRTHGSLLHAQRVLNKDAAHLKTYQGLQTSADNYVKKFNTLESQISGVQSLRDAAGANPSDRATGYNPLSGRTETKQWAAWNGILGNLDSQHTKMLKTAFEDLNNLVSKNVIPNNLTNLGYVGSLESALSQSIGTGIADAFATDPNAPAAPPADVPGKSVTRGGITYNYPEALSDFLDVEGKTNMLDNLNLAYTRAQLLEQANPGDPAGLAAEQSAAGALSGFYGDIYKMAGSWINPVVNAPDPSLINEAGQAYLAAQQTAAGLTNPGGPTQGQLASTALSSLYASYGSNALLAAAQGSAPNDLAAALQGGANAGQALASQGRASVVAQRPVAGPAATQNEAQQGHTVINNFSHPPEDPHSWSKGILWELNA